MSENPFAIVQMSDLRTIAEEDGASEVIQRVDSTARYCNDIWIDYIGPKIEAAVVSTAKVVFQCHVDQIPVEELAHLHSDGSVWECDGQVIIPSCIPAWAASRIADHFSGMCGAKSCKDGTNWQVTTRVKDAIDLSKRMADWYQGFNSILMNILEEEMR
jgi:hypothetical protein